MEFDTGFYMTYTSLMKTISISELKSHLSAEIKSLTQEEGILVLDRANPVAVLSAYESRNRFTVIPPVHKIDLQKLNNLCAAVHPTGTLTDPLVFILEDRQSR